MPKKTAAKEPVSPPAATKGPTKIETLLGLLRSPDGADVQALSQATGSQAHSVRGAIAGHIKKKLKLEVTTSKVEGRTVYRIAPAAEVQA